MEIAETHTACPRTQVFLSTGTGLILIDVQKNRLSGFVGDHMAPMIPCANLIEAYHMLKVVPREVPAEKDTAGLRVAEIGRVSGDVVLADYL